MDPLTHTLVGASLASTRLGRTTRLATPALVIGANLPDLDVLAYLRGADFAFGFRRGWTHGVPALALLPALLAAALWLWSRRRPEPERSRVRGGWLTALCYFAVLTHPALDWLNTYGMRWWMPFRDVWSYGDAVFIMDPWLWLALGGCWLLPSRPTRGLAIALATVTGLLLLVVAARAPQYLAVVLLVAALLGVALIVRLPPRGRAARALPALGLALAAGYITGMIWLQALTEKRVQEAVSSAPGRAADQLMVAPRPVDPRRWDVVYLDGDGRYRFGSFDWRRGGELSLSPVHLTAARRAWLQEQGGEQIPGFLLWVRFPWIEARAADGPIHVMDARYARRRTTGFGGAVIESPRSDDGIEAAGANK